MTTSTAQSHTPGQPDVPATMRAAVLKRQQVRAQLDEVWFLDAPRHLRLSRLVDRHVLFGKDRPAAQAWAAGSDETNAPLIEASRHAADRIIPRS